MNTHTTGTPLRIRTVDDVLGVIPGLLGFHPEESLVVVVIADGLVEVTARLDLADATLVAEAGAADPLETLWSCYPDASFLVVVYTASAEQAWPVLDRVTEALDRLDVLLLVHADGTHWYDRPWGDGTPYDVRASALAAELAFRGLPVRSQRGDLERMIEPAWSPDEVVEALEQLELEHLGRPALRARAAGLHAEAMSAPRTLTLPEALLLAIAAHDPEFTDDVVLGLTRDNAATAVGLWVQVVQGTSPGTSGPALVLLALAAWVSGQGALQVVCLTRASTLVPGHPWLEFCDLTNRDVVPPSAWDDLRTDFVLARREVEIPTL